MLKELVQGKYPGERPPFFQQIGIESGWIYGGFITPEIDESVRQKLLSVEPGGINIFAKRSATKTLEHMSSEFGLGHKNSVIRVIYYDNNNNSFRNGYVLVSDLKKTSEQISRKIGEIDSLLLQLKDKRVIKHFSREREMKVAAFLILK